MTLINTWIWVSTHDVHLWVSHCQFSGHTFQLCQAIHHFNAELYMAVIPDRITKVAQSNIPHVYTLGLHTW